MNSHGEVKSEGNRPILQSGQSVFNTASDYDLFHLAPLRVFLSQRDQLSIHDYSWRDRVIDQARGSGMIPSSL